MLPSPANTRRAGSTRPGKEITMEENESLYGEQAGEVVEPQDGEAAAQAEGEKSPDTAEQGRQSHEDNRRYQAARRAGEQAGY